MSMMSETALQRNQTSERISPGKSLNKLSKTKQNKQQQDLWVDKQNPEVLQYN